MVREIRIYFEGDQRLRQGFYEFFRSLRDRANPRYRIELIAVKGTPARDFSRGIRRNPDAWNILLKDSEGPHTGQLSSTYCHENGWAQDRADLIFWMVEMMESWFHADKDELERFYGTGFRKGALKQNPSVEEISKKDLRDGLSNATRHTKKGDYFDNKTVHGSQLLAAINPELVRKAAPNCARLFDAILAKLT